MTARAEEIHDIPGGNAWGLWADSKFKAKKRAARHSGLKTTELRAESTGLVRSKAPNTRYVVRPIR